MSDLVPKKSVIACLKQDSMEKMPPLFDRIEAALPETSPPAEKPPRRALRIPRYVPACAACIAVCLLALALFPPGKKPSATSALAVGAASLPSGYSSIHEALPSSDESVSYAGEPGSLVKGTAQGSHAADSAAAGTAVGSPVAGSPGSAASVPQTSGAVSGAGASQVSTLTFGQAEKEGNSVTSSIAMPTFISYGGGIYNVDYTAAAVEKLQKEYIGELLPAPASNFLYYAVQGLSPNQEIAMQSGGSYVPCTYLCSDIVTFHGTAYVIGSTVTTTLNITESDGKATPANGKYIGMAGTLPAYSIDGIDPKQQIAVNLVGEVYADAVKQ